MDIIDFYNLLIHLFVNWLLSLRGFKELKSIKDLHSFHEKTYTLRHIVTNLQNWTLNQLRLKLKTNTTTTSNVKCFYECYCKG